jgi:RPA family protein
MQTAPRRQTAFKVWIQNVHTSQEKIKQDTGLPYLDIKEKQVVRVHLFGSVVDKNIVDGYGSVVLDDSSASIRLKVWGEDVSLLESLNTGDLVFVVGRYAMYQDERYVRPEIVRRVSMDWALFRRLELTKEYGLPSMQEKVLVKSEELPVEEVEPSLSLRENIISEIEKEDEVSESQLVEACKMPADKVLLVLQDLLKEGEVFCPKKGYYRLV